jgi:hypothetical protein
MSYISGSREALVAMLEDAFECGFDAGADERETLREAWLDYYYTVLSSELGEELENE